MQGRVKGGGGVKYLGCKNEKEIGSWRQFTNSPKTVIVSALPWMLTSFPLVCSPWMAGPQP
jgi:hypothetical protein